MMAKFTPLRYHLAMRQERDDQVVILAAGLGTRMGESHHFAPKAVLPLWGKPALAWILEQFPKTSEILIAVGFEAQDIKDLVHTSFQDRKITFVPVERFSGKGSGPGHSLLCCRPFLHGPFTLVCADTIWNEAIPLSLKEENWVGAARVSDSLKADYCMVEAEHGLVTSLIDKPAGPVATPWAFTGLAHVKDHELFFEGIQKAETHGQGEVQLASGFNALVQQGLLRTQEIKSWIDIGTEKKYLDACRQREDLSFRKHGEFFYILNGRVIKYFKDEKTAQNRHLRAQHLGSLGPGDVQARGRFLSYPFMPGHSFYSGLSESSLSSLLKTLDEQFWRPASFPENSFTEVCQEFYRNRLFSRAADLAERAPFLLGNLNFSDGYAGNAKELLNSIDWNEMAEGQAYRIHGDLQADNILVHDGGFKLIDWRQDFGGQLEAGDLYYDRAKLHASLGVDFSKLKAGAFEVKIEANDFGATIEFIRAPQLKNGEVLQAQVLEFARKKGLDPRKIQTLSALIFLYIASLHPENFMIWSWCYGVRQLFGLGIHGIQEKSGRPELASYNVKCSSA